MPEPESHPYAEIGGMLRTAREEMRLSTRDASGMLHIRACYLDALEEGRFDALPGHAYAKGYLQSYAAFLQLDRSEILRQFERVEASLRRGFFLPQSVRREKKPNRTAIWGGLGVALFLYIMWLFMASPTIQPVSVVDAAPKPDAIRVGGKTIYPYNPACFREGAVLYPPCHMTLAKQPEWLLPVSPVKSVMDLAH